MVLKTILSKRWGQIGFWVCRFIVNGVTFGPQVWLFKTKGTKTTIALMNLSLSVSIFKKFNVNKKLVLKWMERICKELHKESMYLAVLFVSTILRHCDKAQSPCKPLIFLVQANLKVWFEFQCMHFTASDETIFRCSLHGHRYSFPTLWWPRDWSIALSGSGSHLRLARAWDDLD